MNITHLIGDKIVRKFKNIKNKSTTQVLNLSVDLTEATFNNDTPLVINNVAILGQTSVDTKGRVKRKYSDNCLQQACSIFEGAPAFIDHPTPDKKTQHRSIKDMYGFYRGVRAELAEHKLRGDLHLFDSDLGRHVAAVAKSNPALAGNSIHAAGKIKMENGVQVVEEILPRNMWGVRASVDLVSDPATTKTLFESVNDNNLNKESDMELGNLTLAIIKEERDDLYSAVLAEGVASRNKEVDDLKVELKEHKTKRAEAEAKLDVQEAKAALAEQRAVVDKALSDSDLPEKGITDTFRSTLYGLTESKEGDKVITVEEQIKTQIEDRRALLGMNKVHGTGGDHHPLKESKSSGKKEGTDVILGSIADCAR